MPPTTTPRGAVFDVSFQPGTGLPDKPFHGRINGTWVVSALNEQRARRLLFQFDSRRHNPDIYPVLGYMVRPAVDVDYYPCLDLDDARAIADELGGTAHVMAVLETSPGTFRPRGIVYRTSGSDIDEQPVATVKHWAKVDPASLRIGDYIELPPTETRRDAIVVRITGYTGRQSLGRTAERTLTNVLGEKVGSADLPLGTDAILVFDHTFTEANHLHALWHAASTLAGAGLLAPQDFDRVRRRVQGDLP